MSEWPACSFTGRLSLFRFSLIHLLALACNTELPLDNSRKWFYKFHAVSQRVRGNVGIFPSLTRVILIYGFSTFQLIVDTFLGFVSGWVDALILGLILQRLIADPFTLVAFLWFLGNIESREVAL